MRGERRKPFRRHRLQRKPRVSDPGMHHGTCVTHVPCCMSGLLTRSGGENVSGIPGACATRNFTYLARGPCCARCYARHVYTFYNTTSRFEISYSDLLRHTIWPFCQCKVIQVWYYRNFGISSTQWLLVILDHEALHPSYSTHKTPFKPLISLHV